MPAVSTPDSPTHTLRPAVDLSNAPWTTAFHAPCPQIQGQMLPEESLSHAKIYPAATMPTRKRQVDNIGCGPEAYCPLRIKGVCHSPHAKPLIRMGARIPESTNRVSM